MNLLVLVDIEKRKYEVGVLLAWYHLLKYIYFAFVQLYGNLLGIMVRSLLLPPYPRLV